MTPEQIRQLMEQQHGLVQQSPFFVRWLVDYPWLVVVLLVCVWGYIPFVLTLVYRELRILNAREVGREKARFEEQQLADLRLSVRKELKIPVAGPGGDAQRYGPK